jgi:hypothetical protein
MKLVIICALVATLFALSQCTPIDLGSEKNLDEQAVFEDVTKDNAVPDFFPAMAKRNVDVVTLDIDTPDFDDFMAEMLQVMQKEDDEKIWAWLKEKGLSLKQYLTEKLQEYWDKALQKAHDQLDEVGNPNVEVPTFDEMKNIALCAPKVVIDIKSAIPSDGWFSSASDKSKLEGWNTVKDTLEECMTDVRSVADKCQESKVMQFIQSSVFKPLFPPWTTKMSSFVKAACVTFQKVETIYDKTKSAMDEIASKLDD